MVVIFGHQNDRCSCFAYEHLRQWGIEPILIEGSHLLANVGINWSLARYCDSALFVGSRKIAFSTISGVLVRMRDSIEAQDDAGQPDQEYIHHEVSATLTGLLNAFECRVVNRPLLGASFGSILTNEENIRRVIDVGFQVPVTLVTSSHESAVAFYASCDRSAIVGLPSDQWFRLLTGDEGNAQLPALLSCSPIYLQKVPQGQWLRVFTAGNRVFAASRPIETNAELIGKVPLQAVRIPPKLREQAYRLSHGLGLEFGQIDLLRTNNGDLYCLGISDYPNYDQCEESLQQDITASLVALLIKSD